jgi:hypothetical protein
MPAVAFLSRIFDRKNRSVAQVPKGGKRQGAGRPTREVAAQKARAIAEAIAKGPQTSVRAFAQGILDSPRSSTTEKFKACEILAKLPPEVPSSVPMPDIRVLSVPPKSRVDIKTGVCTLPGGEVVEPTPIEFYPPTPMLPPMPDEREPLEPLPFEVTEAEVPENLVRLDPYRRRDGGEPGPGAA